MSNNLLRYTIIAGLFAIPFIPLVVAKSLFFPFITGKAFAFRLIVEIVFAAWVVLALRDGGYRMKWSYVSISVLAFLIALGISTVLSENPFKSFWSNFERMEGFVGLLHFAALFVVMGSVLRSQEIWNKLLATHIGASAIMAIYSFFQIAGKISINQGGVRVDGTFGNATYLGIYMVFNIFFAGLLYVRSYYGWQKMVLAAIALADLVVLYFTATRGAILGLLGGAIITFAFLGWKGEVGSKVKKVSIGIVLGVIAFVGLFVALRNTSFVEQSPVLSRFGNLSFEEIKTQGRYFVWPMAWKGFLERPVFGWGQESFNFVFNKYYNPAMYNQEPWFDRTHNIVLDSLISGGLLGFLSYFSIFISLLYYIRKASDDFMRREDKAIILGLLSAYAFHNLFVFDQIGSYIMFFSVLAYVHAHAAVSSENLFARFFGKFKNLKDRLLGVMERNQAIFESVVVILLIAVVYFVNFVPWRLNKSIIAVLAAGSQGEVKELSFYKEPLKNNVLGFSESLEHISQVSIGFTQNSNVSNELRAGLFDALDSSFKTHIENVPNDARYRLFYGLFLSRYGWYGRALEQLREAERLSPSKQSIKFEIVNNLILENKKSEALSVAKSAYELEPEYFEAKWVYALAALSVGDPMAKSLMAEIDENQLIFDDRYMGVLLSLGDTAELIRIAKRRIELEPDNLQHRITLTAAYLQAGERQNAISTLEDIIKVSPSFKERGEYYISEIKAGRNP